MNTVPLTNQNLDDCTGVFLKSYNQPPWNYHWTFDKAKQYLSEYMNCTQFVGFILYDEGEPVGAILGHKKTWWTGPQFMIDEFFISPERQRKGYGKKLLDFCDQYANENGIELLILMTNKYMPAYQFYTKSGYINTEQYVFMFKQLL
ncbi:MAG TPA: GNAT family N-acetyltransferase [Mucilaginibacter sp.]|jgi:aminoglycoside 6'-N-acetyltransferase I|nr:GNAT family N-acetyltransferase [Mucilaginibacter sp.]